MHSYINFRSIAVVFALYVLLAPSTAQAYLDAGTGSYLIQMAVALIAGGLFMIKIFWQRLWTVVSRKKKKHSSTEFYPHTEEASSTTISKEDE